MEFLEPQWQTMIALEQRDVAGKGLFGSSLGITFGHLFCKVLTMNLELLAIPEVKTNYRFLLPIQ